MNILFIGDIFGRPGREIAVSLVPQLRQRYRVDFCIANAENAAAGKGLTEVILTQLLSCGIDVVTGGNHIWHKKEIIPVMEKEPRLIRPANLPEGTPGRGAGIFTIADKYNIAVVQLIGRIYLACVDCPFQVIRRELNQLKSQTNMIIVDMHAEATSEKVAMGWYLDGEVSAVVGTHTHIQTADEKILPKGTAYITDVGMTGPHDSVIGVKKEIILKMFLTQLPVTHEVASDDVKLQAVLLTIDELTGKATAISRLSIVNEDLQNQ
ncbi:MAG: TIGR00282 family metallophosphoesterase [bacterium]|nr:TIGR00282 family metallophosphoesterase [bacterium]